MELNLIEWALFAALVLLLWLCVSPVDTNRPSDLVKHDQNRIEYEEYIYDAYEFRKEIER